jgi:multimeric flavodoxin WrbA
MKRGIYKKSKGKLDVCKGKPLIIGISSGKRGKYECAREDPVSLHYLKLALRHAKKAGAKTQLIDLRRLKIEPCKECYSTCPAQCRFNETSNQCDCYAYKRDMVFYKDDMLLLEKAYDKLSKEQFFKLYHNEGTFAKQDDMYVVYEAMRKADGIIFATSTQYYGRPSLLQNMISRMTALDGGVEELWGDGKNLRNSIKYARDKKAKYKQRLYNKWCAFINCSKEGDSVTPNLMKACSMMGMKILPLGVAYRVNWYDDPTHRSDTKKSKKDKYTLSLLKHIGEEMVKQIKLSPRKYGVISDTV